MSARATRVYDADHRVPPIRDYLVDTWDHLTFANEKAKLDLQAAHKNTWFGRLWNVLNPLLLGVVYWLLVIVIFGSGEGGIADRSGMQVLAQILGGLFLFQLPSASLALGSRSIIGGGSFVLNTRLPRLLLPISAVISAFRVFFPSLGVYAVIHVIAGDPIGFHLLWAIPLVAILTVISLGLAMTVATLTVYFRDVASFLPYVTRIWLYLTPIIYLYDNIPEALGFGLYANPIGSLFAAWQQVLFEGRAPSMGFVATAVAWAFAALAIGIVSFLRREREFAVRI
jgi:teichoic acid transport system permease protein